MNSVPRGPPGCVANPDAGGSELGIPLCAIPELHRSCPRGEASDEGDGGAAPLDELLFCSPLTEDLAPTPFRVRGRRKKSWDSGASGRTRGAQRRRPPPARAPSPRAFPAMKRVVMGSPGSPSQPVPATLRPVSAHAPSAPRDHGQPRQHADRAAEGVPEHVACERDEDERRRDADPRGTLQRPQRRQRPEPGAHQPERRSAPRTG